MPNDEKISDIREWLVEINTNQKHHTRVLERMESKSAKSLSISRKADEKSDRALSKSIRNRDNLYQYKNEQYEEKKWIIRTIVTILGIGTTFIMFLIPIITSYYTE